MTTLYELTGEMLELLAMAEEPDIDAQALADTMEAIEGEFEDKADGYAKVISQLNAQAEMLKAEEDRLAKRRKAMTNSAEQIKKRLEASMIATGKTKFKTQFFSFGIQKNPKKVVLAEGVDINDIPAEYLRFSEPKLDNTAVKEAIEKGVNISWASLVQEEGLRIR